jgi:GTP-binding protein
MFIDRVKVEVRAGNGGHGCVSFHREKFAPRGGPDGGNGGTGGDVVFYVDPGETVLSALNSKPVFQAQNGRPGDSNNKTGRSGQGIRIPVPPGTVVRNAETGKILCELVDLTAEAVVAAGGKGGKGNAMFANAIHQAPTKATPGEPGEAFLLEVELKIVADIGLVGFPNAGKSTLINAITSARAKVASYPFTTLNPVIGTLPLEPAEIADLIRSQPEADREAGHKPRIVIADIPGILEGAHRGVGLGLDFLRHIERTRVLVFVLDVSVDREHEPVEAYRSLVEEIASYKAELLEHPRLIVLNKIDNPLMEVEIDDIEANVKKAMAEEEIPPDPGTVFRISALKGFGLEPLRKSLVDIIIERRQDAAFWNRPGLG